MQCATETITADGASLEFLQLKSKVEDDLFRRAREISETKRWVTFDLHLVAQHFHGLMEARSNLYAGTHWRTHASARAHAHTQSHIVMLIL